MKKQAVHLKPFTKCIQALIQIVFDDFRVRSGTKQNGIICVHKHFTNLNAEGQIIDMNNKKERAQYGTMWNTRCYV